MNDMHEAQISGQEPMYHVDDLTTTRYDVAWVAQQCGGTPPRLFAFVREDFTDTGEVTAEIVAYGIVLPDGLATTCTPTGTPFGKWRALTRAAHAHDADDLVWLTPTPS